MISLGLKTWKRHCYELQFSDGLAKLSVWQKKESSHTYLQISHATWLHIHISSDHEANKCIDVECIFCIIEDVEFGGRLKKESQLGLIHL